MRPHWQYDASSTTAAIAEAMKVVRSMPFDTELLALRSSHIALLHEIVILIAIFSDGLENFAGITLADILLEPDCTGAKKGAMFSLRLVAEELLVYRGTLQEQPILKRLAPELQWIANNAEIEILGVQHKGTSGGEGTSPRERGAGDEEDEEDDAEGDDEENEDVYESFTEDSSARSMNEDSQTETPAGNAQPVRSTRRRYK